MVTRHISFVLSALLVAGATQLARAETKLTYEDILAHLTDLHKLPVIEPGVRCLQASSYDRASKYDEATDKYINWDANDDFAQYISVDPETKEGLMADIKGPGCIFRIWSANPKGVLRFYLDGDTKPTYEWDFRELVRGKIKPFIAPLIWVRDPKAESTASNFYAPISFAKSCKITGLANDDKGQPGPPRQYYIIDYRTFPAEWQVETFKLPLTDSQEKALKETAHKWANPPTITKAEAKIININPGETVTVSELKGPAVITELRAKLHSKEKWATRKVLLRAYWDGQDIPAIDCPIGDFFGEPKDVAYRSYPMGITDDLNYCLFPMPFGEQAKIVLVNQGKHPARVKIAMAHENKDVPENWGRFHAKWRGEKDSTSFDYPLIEATGTGKLVGICLFPDNLRGGWWGEGDEKVYVDGEKFPSWFGTGSEDYFGDAWGIVHFQNPAHGHPQKSVERMQGCYRWHMGDNIPYYKSFKMTIENYAGQADKERNDYSSVAYWYQLPGGNDFFKESPVEERIPRGFIEKDAIEAENALVASSAPPGATTINDELLPIELSGGFAVKLAGKAGEAFDFTVIANTAERYEVQAVAARDMKASKFDLFVSGNKVENNAPLVKGINTVTLVFTGEPVKGETCEVVIDYIKIEPFRNFIPEWLMVGPFANPDEKGFETEYSPEVKFDPAARYKGRDDEEITWKKISEPKGIFVLNEFFEPQEKLVVFGACVVESPEDANRTLLLGSDDCITVWLNGQKVWANRTFRALVPDNDRVDVQLKKGPNLLLIKIVQENGDVGWAARFLDPELQLKYSLPQ